MFKPIQSRTLTISGASLPTCGEIPVLSAVRIAGTDKLGTLYKYTLDVMTVDEPTLGVWQAKELVSPNALIGTEITAAIEYEGNGTFKPGLPGDTARANLGAGKREITGLITAVCSKGADDRHAYYRLTIRPWLWLATRNRENRIFQNQSVVEITDSILKDDRYGFPCEFRLAAWGFRSGFPKRDYVRQFWESDFEFLSRLWREWGLYFFMEGSTLVLCDSPGSHKAHGEAYETISYHPPDGKRIDEEHIRKLAVAHELTAGTVSLIDYDYTRARAQLGASKSDPGDTAFANAEHYAWGDYSQPLAGSMGLSDDPNDFQREAEYLARVRVDALRCRSLRARGTGNVRGMVTGQTFRLRGYPIEKANIDYLVVSTRIDIRNVDETSRPSDAGAHYQCVTDFVLQPANVFFRNRAKAKRPRCGAETAIVVGPQDQPMWVDGYARIKVQFIWDRQGTKDQNASCWVRVSSPWQGNGFGAIYLPRVNQEITVSYHEDDPDKPYVSDRQVNQFNQPPWELPKNQALSGTRTRDLEGSQSNHIAADDTPGKLQVQVASDYGQSRLVLGYNTRIEGREGRLEARGEGAEYATNLWAVFRANRGMLLSTETRAGATAPAKDMGETVQRLSHAYEQHVDTAQTAQRHKAQQAQASQNDAALAITTQNDAIRGGVKTPENPFPELTRPDMVIASAAGFATSAAQSTHLASHQDHAVTAGRDVSFSSGRSFLAAVRGAVSLFAYQLGMKLIAANGKVEIQAQSDEMALAALKDITITSTDSKIILTADKEIWIGAGGSYIKINAAGIENGTPGHILEKTSFWDKPGPAAMRMPMPVLPLSTLTQNPVQEYTQVFDISTLLGHGAFTSALDGQPYRIYLPDGTIQQQGMLTEGATARVQTASSMKVKCEIGAGAWSIGEDTYDQHELDDHAHA